MAGTEQAGISPIERRIRQTTPAAKNNGSYETVLEEKLLEKSQSAQHAGIHSVLSVLLQT